MQVAVEFGKSQQKRMKLLYRVSSLIATHTGTSGKLGVKNVLVDKKVHFALECSN